MKEPQYHLSYFGIFPPLLQPSKPILAEFPGEKPPPEIFKMKVDLSYPRHFSPED